MWEEEQMHKNDHNRIVDEYIIMLVPFDPKTFLFELLQAHDRQVWKTFDEITIDFDEWFPLLAYVHIKRLEYNSEQQEKELRETHPCAKIVKVLHKPSKKMSLHYNIQGESNSAITIFALSLFSPVF